MKNDNFRCGYRDAMLGADFILEDMPTRYYDGVTEAMRQKSAVIDWYDDNLTLL